jgi:Stress responsive A/B Barrel Domain
MNGSKNNKKNNSGYREHPILYNIKMYMKKIIAFVLMIIAMTSVAVAQNNTGKTLRHVVLLKFKDGTTAADIKKVEDAFRALPSKIKEIKSLEWGINNSPESLNQGFTHCFFVSFSNEKDRAVYLPHPAHKAFGETLHPYLDKVLVIDYWAEK